MAPLVARGDSPQCGAMSRSDEGTGTAVYSDGGDTIYVMDQVGDANTDADWVDEMMIKDQIRQLDDRERNILYKRFMEGKTQMEVAAEIGISQAQVSRLEKTALRRIKGK